MVGFNLKLRLNFNLLLIFLGLDLNVNRCVKVKTIISLLRKNCVSLCILACLFLCAQRQDNDRLSECIDTVESSVSSGVAVVPAGTHATSVNCVVRAFVFVHQESKNIHSHIHEGNEAVWAWVHVHRKRTHSGR